MKKVLNAAWFLLVAVQAQAEQSTQWQVTLGAGGSHYHNPLGWNGNTTSVTAVCKCSIWTLALWC